MDEILKDYIESTFNFEMKLEIYKSFNLFFDYSLENFEEDFIEITMLESKTAKEDNQDRFIILLNEKIDFIVRAHQLKLSEEATLEQKNELLRALFRLQSLEDYTGVISILETTESNLEKFAIIIADISNLDEATVHELVISDDFTLLASLKSYIYLKEDSEYQEVNESEEVVEQAKHFFKFFDGDYVGRRLAKSVLLGQRFESYLPFIEDSIVVPDNDETAINILSIIYISSDTFNDPLNSYRKHSLRILHDLNAVSKIEEHVIGLIGKFEEYKKVKSEK